MIVWLQNLNYLSKVGAVLSKPRLTEISISGIGVIEKSNLEFGPGLTVITGETGAGKTMVLTALNLVLGGKADSSLIRHGQERAVANATFEIPEYIVKRFDEKGVISENGELIITRTVSKDGKSKAAASGMAVNTATLQEIAEDLVMVHGQSTSLTLTKGAKQLELLDLFAKSELTAFRKSFLECNEIAKRIKIMKSAGKEREQKLNILRDFAAALIKTKPKSGELQELEDEISRLSSVEALTNSVENTNTLLEDDQAGILAQLGNAKKSLEKARTLDSSLSAIAEQLNDAYFELQDIAANLSGYLSDLVVDPNRLENLQNRKAELNAFIKRHAISITSATDPHLALHEIMEFSANIDNEIADLDGGEIRITDLENELVRSQQNSVNMALAISKIRKEAASKMERIASAEIHALSMPNSNLKVVIESGTSFEDLTINGLDEVNFYLQTHNDAPLVSITKGASGGELSRIALAIEVVIAGNEEIGTYIFDEIDAGVGGKAAIEVGRRLKQLSKVAQVIVVTHLPQVAAWGDTHFVVSKDETGSVSFSQVRKVSDSQRVEEIARMLAGHEDSISAQKHAQELIAISQ